MTVTSTYGVCCTAGATSPPDCVNEHAATMIMTKAAGQGASRAATAASPRRTALSWGVCPCESRAVRSAPASMGAAITCSRWSVSSRRWWSGEPPSGDVPVANSSARYRRSASTLPNEISAVVQQPPDRRAHAARAGDDPGRDQSQLPRPGAARAGDKLGGAADRGAEHPRRGAGAMAVPARGWRSWSPCWPSTSSATACATPTPPTRSSRTQCSW